MRFSGRRSTGTGSRTGSFVPPVETRRPVGKDAAGTEIKKDLAYLVDIEPLPGPDGDPVPYTNSAGTEGEGWFAVQDLTVVGDGPSLPLN